MELLGNVGHGKSCFGTFGDVLMSVQDSCMVCAKRTIGSVTVLDAPECTILDAPFWSVP
jgi:hypothetical protein